MAALWGEGRHGLAQHLFFFGLLNERFRDGRRFGYREVRICVAAYETLLLLLPAIALVMSDLHEPFRKRARFPQLGKAFEKLHAGCLKNVGGLVRRQSVLDGDRIDQGFVLINKKRPSLFAARQAFFNEALIAPWARWSPQRFGDHWRHRRVFSVP